MTENEPVKRGRKPKYQNDEERKQHHTEYMREYMRMRYNNDKRSSNIRRQTDTIKSEYDIDKEWIDKYKYDLVYVKRLKDLVEKMGDTLFNQILTDFRHVEFREKSKENI